MPSLSGLTIQQLRGATVTQIRDAMSARLAQLTKRQLIRLELYVAAFDQDARVTLSDDRVSTYREDRQIASCVDVTRDELGAKVGSRHVEWTYYEEQPNKPVDTITITERDATDQVVTQKRIKHFADGRQPVEVA